MQISKIEKGWYYKKYS